MANASKTSGYWAEFPVTYRAEQVATILRWVAVGGSGVVIGGTQDNGTIRFIGGTENWARMMGADGGWCAADTSLPTYFYGETQWGRIHRSTNSGASASPIYFGLQDAESQS